MHKCVHCTLDKPSEHISESQCIHCRALYLVSGKMQCNGSLPVQCQHSASKQCTAISSECTCGEIKVFQGFSLHHWRLAKFIESYYQCNFFFDNCDDITMMMMMSIAIAVDNVEGMIGEGHSSRRRLCQCAMTVFVTQDMEHKRCNTRYETQDMEHKIWNTQHGVHYCNT